MASVAGLYGNMGQCNYSASKGAVIAMTRTAAKELGARGITVNAIAPGFIETPMTDSMTDQQKEAILSRITLGRAGTPEDVAAAVREAHAGYLYVEELTGSGAFLSELLPDGSFEYGR